MLKFLPKRRFLHWNLENQSGRSGLLARLSSEQGFTLIELLVASVILVIASAPVTSVLLTGSHLASTSLLRSSADELASAKIELVRAMPYDNIGFSGGNPGGTIASSNTLLYGPTTINGTGITIAYDISYINDHGAKTTTYADYKRVIVTITKTSDGSLLSTKTTNVSPLTGAADGGSEYVDIRRLIVDVATGNPVLPNATVALANGPSAPRSDTTDSTGNVIFPELAVNTSATNFYDVSATLAGYATYPGDFPYSGTGNPAMSLEQVNHRTGNDDLQTIHMYKTGGATTVTVYKADGVTSFPTASIVYMGSTAATNVGSSLSGAGLAGNSATASTGAPESTTFTSLQLDNSYVTPSVPTVPIFPGSYTFSAQSGTTSSMTYAVPQTNVSVPNSYPTDLTKTVKLLMNSAPCTSNATLTVTVKRGTTVDPDAHVEVSSTATTVANAPSVYLWGDTDANGQVAFIIPRGKAFTVKATDARGSTAQITGQDYSGSGTATAALTITP